MQKPENNDSEMDIEVKTKMDEFTETFVAGLRADIKKSIQEDIKLLRAHKLLL